MTYEELFDAYREVVSQRDQLALAGDALWGEYGGQRIGHNGLLCDATEGVILGHAAWYPKW